MAVAPPRDRVLPAAAGTEARDLVVSGHVQGVGYRPFVYRTAHRLGLAGWVLNGAGRVFIHAEGPLHAIEALGLALIDEAPPLARPRLERDAPSAAEGFEGFEIRRSDATSAPDIHVPPDYFACDECVAEMRDPEERRHRYPFTNCTNCGPRYTIITGMPYDRPNTSMAGFPLCPDCAAEYGSPLDRRFHAQPLACPACGPSLRFVRSGERVEGNEAALAATVDALRGGHVVAVKGVGGYHLVCDATDEDAVATLRRRKRRPDKPLAVMFPLAGADGLDQVRRHARPRAEEAAAIADPARPIVLVRRREDSGLAPGLAPSLAELGVFLPYSPLHHLLLGDFGGPVVATSGNVSGEPVITDPAEAERRLAGVADAFLHHDRPIVRPADDPVLRAMGGRARLIRPGRGIAPMEFTLPAALPRPLLCTGGHMKNTLALAWGRRVVVSPHVGDLDSPRSLDVFGAVARDLPALFAVEPAAVVCDAHPGYASSRWAAQRGLPVIRVQHHRAHASALAGEHPDVERWLVFTWDGVGYGDDGTLWGGEAFLGAPGQWKRVASFRPFHPVGGDRVGREPWRSAAALCWAEGAGGPDVEGADLARTAWQRGLGRFETSAAGRLFDAAAALVLGRHHASFEGQGPMELEALAAPAAPAETLPLQEDDAGVLRADWAPLLPVLTDEATPAATRAGRFHDVLAETLLAQCTALRKAHAFDAVGLSGGVFQNRRLTETAAARLDAYGFDLRLHERVPANDGGLCYGQAIEALALEHEQHHEREPERENEHENESEP